MEAPRFSVVDNGPVIFMALAVAGLGRYSTHPMPSSTDTARGPGTPATSENSLERSSSHHYGAQPAFVGPGGSYDFH